MAINYPTSLDTTAQPSAGQVVDSARIAKLIQMVEALEAKVGVDSSAVTASIDYKVNHVSGDSCDIGENLAGTAFNTFNRKLVPTATQLTAGNGLVLVSVTSPISITAAKINIYITTAGSAGPTTSQLGLFTIAANGNGTLIASTSSTSNFNTTGILSFNLTVPVAVTAGTRYAVGIIQSNGTGPTLYALHNGGSNQSTLSLVNPWCFVLRGGITTMPASFTYANLSAPLGYPEFYAEVST